jgi:hypothetical protein
MNSLARASGLIIFRLGAVAVLAVGAFIWHQVATATGTQNCAVNQQGVTDLNVVELKCEGMKWASYQVHMNDDKVMADGKLVARETLTKSIADTDTRVEYLTRWQFVDGSQPDICWHFTETKIEGSHDLKGLDWKGSYVQQACSA